MANEKRLIDADALVEAIVNTPSEVAKFHTYNVLSSLAERQHEILDLIENQSTVDAVEVVQCKDCKHFDMQRMECQCDAIVTDNEGGADFTVNFDPDDFCSYGERKDNATD